MRPFSMGVGVVSLTLSAPISIISKGLRRDMNEQNLIPFTSEQSREEAKVNGRKGGIASGVAKRRKKNIAEMTEQMLNSALTNEQKGAVQRIVPDITEDDLTVSAAVVAGQIKSAINGNTSAFVALTEQSEKARSNTDKDNYELPARVLGKAYVDIYRHIEPNKAYVFEGGRGSLKSSFVSLMIVELIKRYSNVHACVVRKIGNTLKDSVYAQMKWAINILGLTEEFEYRVSPLEIRYKKTGQVIYFRGADDPVKLKSIKPEFGYIGILWKEEKDQLAGAAEERSINQSVLRGGNIAFDFSSYNPPKSKTSWVNREKLIPDQNRIIHSSTYLDAPPEWLGQKFIDDAEHLKEVNPEAYAHEYMGIPNGEGGNVFEYIEARDITDEEIARMDRIYPGVDFGWYPDQFCYLRTYYDSAREKIYLMDELYVNKWSNEQTATWIKEHGYDDYPMICDSAEPKSINDFRGFGLPARGAVKGAGSVEYGFKWLQRRTIVIDPRRTPNAYREITEYEYERDRDGNVISGYPDGNDHAISALRYAYEPLFNRRGNSA